MYIYIYLFIYVIYLSISSTIISICDISISSMITSNIYMYIYIYIYIYTSYTQKHHPGSFSGGFTKHPKKNSPNNYWQSYCWEIPFPTTEIGFWAPMLRWLTGKFAILFLKATLAQIWKTIFGEMCCALFGTLENTEVAWCYFMLLDGTWR